MLDKLRRKKFLHRLDSKDKLIRKQAIQHFAFNPNQISIIPLRRILLDSKDGKIIRWASYALALNHDQTSKVLIVDKIREIGNPESETVEWLKISHEMLSEQRGVSHIQDLLYSTSINDVKEGLVLSFAHKKKSEKLIKRIADNPFTWNPDVRRWINLTLGNTDNFSNTGIIKQFFSDQEYIVREWAAWALANMRENKSLSTLKEQIVDPHPRVREWVAKAIAKFDSIEVTYFLLHHYYTESDLLCKEGIIRSLNPNRESVQEFLHNELACQKNDTSIHLILAILDKLSESSLKKQFYDTIVDVLTRWNRKDIREAITYIAFANIDSKELPIIKKLLSDPKFNIICECLKETRSLISKDQLDEFELFDSKEDLTNSEILEEILNEVKNLKIVNNSIVNGDAIQSVLVDKNNKEVYTSLDNLEQNVEQRETSTTLIEISSKIDRIPTKPKNIIYSIYENWNDPKQNYDEQKLRTFIHDKNIEDYDIWAQEPGKYYYKGKPVAPRPGIRRLLNVLLCSKNKKFVSIKHMYEAVNRPLTSTIDMIDEMNLLDLRRDLSECNLLFGGCINTRKKCRWIKDTNRPCFKIGTEFKYIYIKLESRIIG